MSDSNDTIHKLDKRVSRLENILWVVSALVVVFGFGGANLWNSLSDARSKAMDLGKKLGDLETQFEAGFPDIVEQAKREVEAHAAELSNRVVVQNGMLGIEISNPISSLHIAGSGYIQIPHTGSTPEPTDCDEPDEAGRLIVHDRGIAVCPRGAGGWVQLIEAQAPNDA